MTDFRFPNYDSHFEPSFDPANEDDEEQCVCEACCKRLEDGTLAIRHIEMIADATDHDGPETAVIWVCEECATPEEAHAYGAATAAKEDAERAKARDLWFAAGWFDDDLPF